MIIMRSTNFVALTYLDLHLGMFDGYQHLGKFDSPTLCSRGPWLSRMNAYMSEARALS